MRAWTSKINFKLAYFPEKFGEESRSYFFFHQIPFLAGRFFSPDMSDDPIKY
jgi:hypothetical protein